MVRLAGTWQHIIMLCHASYHRLKSIIIMVCHASYHRLKSLIIMVCHASYHRLKSLVIMVCHASYHRLKSLVITALRRCSASSRCASRASSSQLYCIRHIIYILYILYIIHYTLQVFCILAMCLAGILFGCIVGEMQARRPCRC